MNEQVLAIGILFGAGLFIGHVVMKTIKQLNELDESL